MQGLYAYLQNPHLVARIQEYFGVKILTNQGGSFNQRQCVDSDVKSENANISQVSNKRKVTQGKRFLKNGIESNGHVSSEIGEETVSSESESESKHYLVSNKFWYYLFVLGTALGDEIFYASFIPFWFWNIDGAVGRRVVLVWTIIMYIGQGIKDIVRIPRPSCPPVVRLQKKWAMEYGMPSTHAMVGVSIPFSVLLYTVNRYQYSLALGLLFAVAWCAVICVSRLYLGMHSVLDVVVGLVLALFLMVPVVPLVDALDHWILTWRWSPVVLLATSILMIVLYPTSDRWTPTRGDTTMIVSVCAGVHVGAWTNYQLGILSASGDPPPYAVIWPSCAMLGLGFLRTAIGFCCVLATRAVGKSASYATLCALPRCSPGRDAVALAYSFATCYLMGFNTVYLLPSVFRLLGIERPTFYTEI
ncbi:sphingosine-1-phosphate phosphatase 1-like [Bacillus rossius redtenbacheri]|uniref:sphingosine-1-phosphate phosphatase 1-like n=1 Tax=Bacillus rossius redtenbacheri TaxID=93214 RepID=UPI002FDDFD7A